jgi:HEPN domain-containing protein
MTWTLRVPCLQAAGGFMLCLCAGKLLKNWLRDSIQYTLYIDDNVPRVHNIKTLFDQFKDKLAVQTLPEVYRLFDVLSGHYLDSRYPDFMNDPAKNVGKTQAESIHNKSKEVFQWLQTLKP